MFCCNFNNYQAKTLFCPAFHRFSQERLKTFRFHEKHEIPNEIGHEMNFRMNKFKSLNKSKEFVKILKKKKIVSKYLIIYFDKNVKNSNNFLNISFVMKKSVGNAVIRNKIKRKLKYAVQKISRERQLINLNYTYVIFGKNNVYKDEFKNVLEEIGKTFEKIHKQDY